MKMKMPKTGKIKGSSVYKAHAKKSMRGSDTFSKSEMDRGYKVMTSASQLHEMDVDRLHYVKDYVLAERRNGTAGPKRTLLRRSEA